MIAVGERFLKRDIVIVMNEKVGPYNPLLGHAMGKPGLGERNNDIDVFGDFCSSHRIDIGGTLFVQKVCHKVNWVLIDNQRTSNQIHHVAINSRFRSFWIHIPRALMTPGSKR